jgi:hypothetical protein
MYDNPRLFPFVVSGSVQLRVVVSRETHTKLPTEEEPPLLPSPVLSNPYHMKYYIRLLVDFLSHRQSRSIHINSVSIRYASAVPAYHTTLHLSARVTGQYFGVLVRLVPRRAPQTKVLRIDKQVAVA